MEILSFSNFKLNCAQFVNKTIAVYGSGEVGLRLNQELQEFNLKTSFFLDDYTNKITDSEAIESRPVSSLAFHQPEVIILGTDKSRQRMTRNLLDAGFTGLIVQLDGNDNDPFKPHNYNRNPEIEKFRNCHFNQEAVIIASGPSIQQTQPLNLRNDLIPFACNSIFLINGFTPNYYFVIDTLVMEQRLEQIKKLSCTKFFPMDFKEHIDDAYFYNSNRVPWPKVFSKDFAMESEVIGTVVYSMLQMAYFMGCDPVYIIGLDHDYSNLLNNSKQDGHVMEVTGKGQSHFHKDYLTVGMKWHYPWIERCEAAYEVSADHYARNGRNIFNATPGSKVNCFKRVDYQKLMSDVVTLEA